MKISTIFGTAILGGLLTAATAFFGEPIRIGGLFDLTGKAQQIGEPTKNVAQMAVDRLNKSGGLKGRMIELVIADTQSEPSQAVVALKRLIEKDKVTAIIGPTTTGAAMACLKTVEDAKVPMVACVGGDAPVTPVRKWIFKTPQKTSTAVESVYSHLQSKKLLKISILTASDKFGQEGEAFLKSSAAKFGLTLAASESFDPMDSDMTVQLSKAAAAKPDAIVVWTIGPAGAVIAKNAKQMGLAMPLFQCHGQPDPNYLKLAGAAANGTRMPSTKLLAASQLPDSDAQKTVEADFIKEFEARGLANMSTHSGYAWDAIQLVFKAMEKAGTEPAALRDAIENTKNYIGVSGVYNLSAADHCGLQTDSLVIVEVSDGKWKLVR